MIHLNAGALGLCFPHSIHKDIHSTLCWCLGVTIEYWHTKNYAGALFPGFRIFFQHNALAVQLGLAVQVRWAWLSISLVRRLSWSPGKDVVR
jgi:hypothetical protein